MDPKNFPKPGLYYHYKHDPNGSIENYAYEVLNIGHHTEMHGDPNGILVIYRPLYSSAFVYQEGRHCDVRPVNMFMEEVNKPEYKGPRFNPVTDPAVIEQLEAKKRELYG